MKKNVLIFLGSLALFLAAKPFKNEKLNPVIEDPQMPGTPVEVKEVNTSPNPTAGENESDTFRGTTLNTKKSKLEEKAEKKTKEKSGEKRKSL